MARAKSLPSSTSTPTSGSFSATSPATPSCRRETITKEIEDSYTHKKQSGGSGQFGKIDYRIKPGEVGSGFAFTSSVVGGNVPKEFWPAVEKGFKSMMGEGVLAGFPVLDVEVELFDGGFHAVDSSAIAFEIAAKGAFRQSIPKAGAQLLEPIMKVDVFTPEDHVGDVIGDLNRRRGMLCMPAIPDCPR